MTNLYKYVFNLSYQSLTDDLLCLLKCKFKSKSLHQSVTVGPILVGDMQHDSKTELDGVSRMVRLQEVGKKLSQMMLNLKRGRRAFRGGF